MGSSSPQVPIRADHRFIKKLMTSVMSGKVSNRPEEFDRVSKQFAVLGGSWVRLFHGSPKDFNILKQVIKVFYKKGLLTKNPKWRP